MDSLTISILIVNWNRREDLQRLLIDLMKQSRPANEIIVVDNGSTDGATQMVAHDFPHVRLISLQQNMGLSYGRNVGIRAARSAAIAVLDNDLRILDRHFVHSMAESLRRHADCGVISFYCVNGLWTPLASAAERKILTMYELERLAVAGQGPVTPRRLYDWFFWGGASVIRREVFERVGLFDEWFINYGEEWDFAYRCHAAGIRLLRDESLWVIHVRSPRLRSDSTLILRNMVIAQSRYMPLTDLLLFLGFQVVKSARDAIANCGVRTFISTCKEVVAHWPTQVMRKRRPVSRETMKRFYYLRTHEPTDYCEVERNGLSAFQFYRQRAVIHAYGETSDNRVFVAMYEPMDRLGESQP